jgi:hypothetical protein
MHFHQHGSHFNHASSSLCLHEATAAPAGITQHCVNYLDSDGQVRGVVSSGVADDEDCPVCQFLAQSVILVSIHKDVDWENLREKAIVAEPVGMASRFPLIQRSRAPPSVV